LCVQNVAASSALDCETQSNIGGVKGSEFVVGGVGGVHTFDER